MKQIACNWDETEFDLIFRDEYRQRLRECLRACASIEGIENEHGEKYETECQSNNTSCIFSIDHGGSIPQAQCVRMLLPL